MERPDDDTGSRAGDTGERADGEQSTDPTREHLLSCLEDPELTTRQLPYVLSQLESDDRTIRLLAAMACCQVALTESDDALIEYLVRRLSDRLTPEQLSLEVTMALDYLSVAFIDQVEPLLAELEQEDGRFPISEAGGFTRSYYYGTSMDRNGVGRMHIAGQGVEEDPSQTVADRRREEREQLEYKQEQTDDETSNEDEEEENNGEFGGSAGEMVSQTAELSAIAEQSRFNALYIRGERHDGRYATTYETLVGERGEQRAVALRLLHEPDPQNRLPTFEQELGEQLTNWKTASDHPNVVTLFDWGVTSQPWVATALIQSALADRDRPSPEMAFENALALVSAVSHLHQHDIVHGGLDSRTIVYPGERFDSETAGEPRLNNVGLINVFRYYFEPSECLDPRYAAPEYYDTRFGRVDHTTDIYQLGSVCYRLFTGEPPFSGQFETVREGVLTRLPHAPSSAVESLPPALDEIIAKAMAKQKLRRYETVEQFRRELTSLADTFI